MLRWQDGKTYPTAHAHLPARNAESDLGWRTSWRIPGGHCLCQADAAVAKALLGYAWRQPRRGIATAWLAARRTLSWAILDALARAAKDLEAPCRDILLAHSSREVQRLSSEAARHDPQAAVANEAMDHETRAAAQQLEEAQTRSWRPGSTATHDRSCSTAVVLMRK